ncbi:MAG: NAD-dependent deacylase [Spirochaetaceae bacterium]|nr:MAG: NAD-dependent deacylase [Spirochaetaceae bacterium]
MTAFDRQLETRITELVALVRSSRYLVAFSGAGISTESGIPDFRGPQGIWTKMRPIELQDFLQDPTARREYWRRKIESYPQMLDAEPNAGHRALARLFEAGLLKTMITQNIDGLHQKAGIPEDRVIELHGSNAYIACLECRKRFEWEEVLPFFARHPASAGECPRCDDCGGWLKPATISFGQAMPEEETRRAFSEAGKADLLITVGTSLLVYPAAGIPGETRRHGGKVVIINNQPTGLDHEAQIFIQGSAGEVLSNVVDRSVGNSHRI